MSRNCFPDDLLQTFLIATAVLTLNWSMHVGESCLVNRGEETREEVLFLNLH